MLDRYLIEGVEKEVWEVDLNIVHI